MITPGGEVSFVSRLIDESLRPGTRQRIQWFSSMLGKLSSVSAAVDKLKASGSTNFAVTEFVQGQKAKTRRWCVAWSWMGYRPGVSVARGVSSSSGVEKRLLPPPSEYDFETEIEIASETDGGLENKLNQDMARLDLLWKYLPRKRMGMLISQHGDVWSRKARRKKLHEGKQQQRKPGGQAKNQDDDNDEEMRDCGDVQASIDIDGSDDSDKEDAPALVARISLIPVASTSATQAQQQTSDLRSAFNKMKTRIHIRHLQGQDPVLFESFSGWLKRKMCTPTPTISTSI